MDEARKAIEQKTWEAAISDGKPQAFAQFWTTYPDSQRIRVVVATVKTFKVVVTQRIGDFDGEPVIEVAGHPELSGRYDDAKMAEVGLSLYKTVPDARLLVASLGGSPRIVGLDPKTSEEIDCRTAIRSDPVKATEAP